jgi:hypothetical protein
VELVSLLILYLLFALAMFGFAGWALVRSKWHWAARIAAAVIAVAIVVAPAVWILIALSNMPIE